MPRLTGRRFKWINAAHLMIWAVPGFIVNWFLRGELWWTNLMSWFAIVLTVGTMWAASRTEAKQDQAHDEGER